MAEVTGIEVQLRAARQAASDADKLERSLDKLGRQGTQTETAFGKLRNSSTKTAGAFDRFKNSVFSAQSALKGLAIAGIAQQIGSAALATESLTNSLRFATGSAEGAADAIKFVREESDRLGLVAISTAKSFSGIAAAAQGTALEGQAVREIFLGVAEASAALGLSADDSEGALRALGQMISKGTVQAEELRGQLGERVPGAFQIASRAMGVTTAELGKMLEQGQVISADFLPKFAAEMRRSFGGVAMDASTGLRASINRLVNAYDELLRTLSETGVIDAATRIITNLSNIVYNTATIFTNAKTAVVEFFDQFRDAPQTLSGTAAKLDLLSKKIVKLSEQRAVSPFPEQLDERIAELRAEYDRVQKVYGELTSKPLTLNATQSAGIAPPPPTPPPAPSLPGLSDAEKAAQRLQSAFESTEDSLRRQIILYGETSEAAQLRYEFEFGALQTLSQQQQNELMILAKRKDLMDAQTDAAVEAARRQEEAQDKVNRKLEESKRFVQDLGLTFSSAFEEAILKASSLSDVLRGLAQDILAITTRKMVTEPFAAGISNIFSGFGFGAPTAHQGGIIGVDAMPSRHVSPSLFDHAPRLHNGGLLSGEIPAILKRGEEVLTESNPRHRNNQGGGQGVTINTSIIVNADNADRRTVTDLEALSGQIVERASQVTEAKIMQSMTRGGAFAKATGRA